MSHFLDRQLPALYAHAHIAPDVTSTQLAQLGASLTFAVTRSLAEAHEVRKRRDPGMIWGCGVHPGVPAALQAYDQGTFERLLDDFVFVGEVGLDRRPTKRQQDVLDSILNVAGSRDVVLSLHSAGCPGSIVEFVEAHQPRGAILHWFTGDTHLVERAAAAGAFFSVNSSSKEDLLRTLPPERILTETDFPATRRSGSRLPADVSKIEDRLTEILGIPSASVRREIWRNFRSLVTAAGVLGRLEPHVAEKVIAA